MLKHTLKQRWFELVVIAVLLYAGRWELALVVFWIGSNFFWIVMNQDYQRAASRIGLISLEGKLLALANKAGVTAEDKGHASTQYLAMLTPEERETAERDLRLATFGPAQWLSDGAQ